MISKTKKNFSFFPFFNCNLAGIVFSLHQSQTTGITAGQVTSLGNETELIVLCWELVSRAKEGSYQKRASFSVENFGLVVPAFVDRRVYSQSKGFVFLFISFFSIWTEINLNNGMDFGSLEVSDKPEL